MDCRCPSCLQLFKAASHDFGERFQCAACGYTDTLDDEHLARFDWPHRLLIQVRSPGKVEWDRGPVTILVSRGFLFFPPLLTAHDGKLAITKEMFQRGAWEEASTDIMGRRDVNLVRNIKIMVPSFDEATRLMTMRRDSGWPALEWEAELYGDMWGLLWAYTSGAVAQPSSIERSIDLTQGRDEVEVILDLLPSDDS